MSNTATGVAQTIETTPGKAYCLSFWIGNVSDPGGAYGTSSSVSVRIDGKEVTVATNDGGQKTAEWRQYTVPFTAAAAQAKIELINADPLENKDVSNLVDNVSVN